MKEYIIVDWANNHLFKSETFTSVEAGWDFIQENVSEETENDSTYDDYYVVEKK